jgi:hypothetical protein
MTSFKYSENHIKRLREFFKNSERNQRLKQIISHFPKSEEIDQLEEDKIKELHNQIMVKLLQDLYLTHRTNLMKWAKITGQTAIVDPEYLSMHLVSLFTGIAGTGTAARGSDLEDGSEVKSSSRVGQLGKCKECGGPVMAIEEKCTICGSTKVERKFDSHWIFSLRTKEEVESLLSTPSIYLVLLDYEDAQKMDTIRIRIWKLDPQDKFVQLFFRDYYFEEFFRKRIDKGERPAPCNLHPDKPLTKCLKPMLLLVAKVYPEDSKITFESINSDGVVERITESEAKTLLSLRKGFFKKISEKNLEDEFRERIKELSRIDPLTKFFEQQ